MSIPRLLAGLLSSTLALAAGGHAPPPAAPAPDPGDRRGVGVPAFECVTALPTALPARARNGRGRRAAGPRKAVREGRRRGGRRGVRVACGLAIALGTAACVAPSAARPSDPAATVNALIAADVRCDLDAALACYADDVVWLPPNAAEVRGRDAIAARYRAMFESFTPDLRVDVVESRADGELAFVRGVTRGELLPRAGGTATAVHDAFVALLRRRDGAWCITHLCWHPTP